MNRYCISDKYCSYKTDTGYCGYTAGCILENVKTITIHEQPLARISRLVDISEESIKAIADAVVEKLRGEE